MDSYRKVFLVGLGIIILLLLIPATTIAADVIYRMLHADESEAFKMDQDAMIVGQLIEKQGDKFNVKVLKVLSGKVNSDNILITDDFTYGWEKTIPMLNDFAVFSLKKEGSYFNKAWGIFKADSGDYKTLKLESLNAPAYGLLGDLACIQWFVNSGGKENDFYGHHNALYVRRPDGQDVQIYPVPTKETKVTGSETLASQESLSQIHDSSNKNTRVGLQLNYVLLVMIVSIVGIGVIFILSRKGKVS